MLKKYFLYILLFSFSLLKVGAQEDNPFVALNVPSQNLLKYNRFLINPTFSTVGQNKSYISALNRAQSLQFSNNNQSYFLSYNGRLSGRSGLAVSLYAQRNGILSNYGALANYSYGVRFSKTSKLTLGTNVAFYNSGFDITKAITVEEDPYLATFENQNILSIQPGLNLTLGKIDIGVFTENLFDYNLSSSQVVTEAKEKTFSGHLQYTHEFDTRSGFFKGASLRPLFRARKAGENDLSAGGSLLLDVPKFGWAQAGYDKFYGAAAGIGFNIKKLFSVGYVMEKPLASGLSNLGLTYEITLAYAYDPKIKEDAKKREKKPKGKKQKKEKQSKVKKEREKKEPKVKKDKKSKKNKQEVVKEVKAPEKQTPKAPKENKELEMLKARLAKNDSIIKSLMRRQDSIESSRQGEMERRFEQVMSMVRKETKGQRPDLEQKAEELFLSENSQISLESQTSKNKDNLDTPVGGEVMPKTIRELLNNGVVDSSNQSNQENGLNGGNDKDESDGNLETETTLTQNSAAKAAAVDDGVKSRTFRNLPNEKDGYYLVVNVFKEDKYKEKFLEILKRKGVEGDVIDNPNNNLKYVYVKRYDTYKEAEEAHVNTLNEAYSWIMIIKSAKAIDPYQKYLQDLKKRTTKYK